MERCGMSPNIRSTKGNQGKDDTNIVDYRDCWSAVINTQKCVLFSMVRHDVRTKWNDAGLLVLGTDNNCNDNISDRRRFIMKAKMVQTFSPNMKMQQIGLFEMYPIARVK